MRNIFLVVCNISSTDISTSTQLSGRRTCGGTTKLKDAKKVVIKIIENKNYFRDVGRAQVVCLAIILGDFLGLECVWIKCKWKKTVRTENYKNSQTGLDSIASSQIGTQARNVGFNVKDGINNIAKNKVMWKLTPKGKHC